MIFDKPLKALKVVYCMVLVSALKSLPHGKNRSWVGAGLRTMDLMDLGSLVTNDRNIISVEQVDEKWIKTYSDRLIDRQDDLHMSR